MTSGKWISALGPDTPVIGAARRVLAVRLELVRDYLGLAIEQGQKDPELVHQLRVNTRRAGAAMEIFACCLDEKSYTVARKQLKDLRRAAGKTRDWDVFLQALHDEKQKRKQRRRPGLDFLTGHALAERLIAQADLEAAGEDHPFRTEKLMAETLAGLCKPETGVRTLLDLATPMLGTLLKDLHQAASGNLCDYGHLHRVRILGKRLRYAMEVFVSCFGESFRERLYPAVEEMQEVLGRANDSHVAGRRLVALRDKVCLLLPDEWKRLKPGINGLIEDYEKRLPQERERFLEWWQQWQEGGLETEFRNQLAARESALS